MSAQNVVELDDNFEPPPSFQQSSSLAETGAQSRKKIPRRGVTAHGGVTRGRKAEECIATTAASSSTVATPHVPSTSAHPPCSGAEHKLTHKHGHEHMSPASHMSARMTSSNNQSTASVKPQSTARSSCSSATKAATAVRTFFDPWNSSSTGHQRAANRLSGSTSWRDSRSLKLREQFREGQNGGGKRIADTVGAGSEGFGKDGRKENGGWERGASGLRTGGQQSLMEVWGATKTGAKSSSQEKSWVTEEAREEEEGEAFSEDVDIAMNDPENNDIVQDVDKEELAPKPIFRNLQFYLNGSTAPLVSDHKLKQLIALRGGNMSIALGRRSVTHVIIGHSSTQGGCGGGLAASKIQKEIARTGGKPVKFVTAEWILACIKADRRVPESSFSGLKTAAKRQGSVLGLLQPAEPPSKESVANG